MKEDHLKRIILETRKSQNRNFTHIISWAAIGKDAIVDFLIFFYKITYAHWSFLSVVVMRTTWNKLEIQQLLISSDARADSVPASVLSKPPQQRSVTRVHCKDNTELELFNAWNIKASERPRWSCSTLKSCDHSFGDNLTWRPCFVY